jgi:hypothetical protein
MKKIKMFFIAISIINFCFLQSCKNRDYHSNDLQKHSDFDFSSFIVNEKNSVKKVSGQVMYLPVYSNIPQQEVNRIHDLSAFVAIHNTDFKNTLKITKVLYFDNDGKLVSNYLSKDTILRPMAAVNFFVPEKDQSGTGANFIVEWVSDSTINEPLIESVMIGLTGGYGVSFLSRGRILQESK